MIHDISKFRPSEWKPYIENFYGLPCTCTKQNLCTACLERKALFKVASHHHKHRNPHHHEYWVDFKNGRPMAMPEGVIREMVADWAGAGRAIGGKWEVWSWYNQQRGQIRLEEGTAKRVDELLELLGRKLQSTSACESRTD